MFIDGPINIIRLQKDDKILYLFFDIHNPKKYQSNCNKEKSINIKKFFEREFEELKKSNHAYDMFMEIQPSILIAGRIKQRGIYIDQVLDLFKNNFNIDYLKNKVGKTKKYPNVRFHYIDIRDYLMFMEILKYYQSTIEYIKKIKGVTIKENELKIIKDGIYMIGSRIVYLRNLINQTDDINMVGNDRDAIINSTLKNPLIFTNENLKNNLQNLLNKIKNKYNNPMNKDIINGILQTDVLQKLDKVIEQIDYILTIVSDNLNFSEDKIKIDGVYILQEISKNLKNVIDDYLVIVSQITDLYFIRRFVDKDYITHGIVYSGGSHSINYIYILIKYFKFEITHYSFLGDGLDNIYKLIKSIDSFDMIITFKKIEKKDKRIIQLYKNFINSFPHPLQCSNFTGFPLYFE